MNISRLRRYFLLALPALFVTPGIAVPTAANAPAVTTKSNRNPQTEVFTAQILAAEKRRYAAMVKADVKALSPLLSNDLTYIRSTGVMQTKIGLLDEVKSGKMRYQKIEPQRTKVRFYGQTAIVTGLTYFELVRYGKEEDVLAVFTAVYVSNGKGTDRHWQLAAWQSNLTPTKKHIIEGNTAEKNTAN